MPAQANASLATVNVGGRTYPAVSERRCRVCSHPDHRVTIEEQTVAGRPWAAILRSLPEDSGLSERNLADHFRNGHLPVANEAVVRLAKQQAHDRGQVVEEAAEAVTSHLEFCRSVVGRVRSRVVAGDLEPTVRDAVAAAGHLGRYEPIDAGLDEAAMVEAFGAYHDTAQQVMSSEQFRQFGAALSANPVLAGLATEWEARNSER